MRTAPIPASTRQGCRTNFIGVIAVGHIQDNHWRGPKYNAASPVLLAIEACRRAGENDRGNTIDAIAHIRSTNIDRWQSDKSHIFAVLVARLSFLSSRLHLVPAVLRRDSELKLALWLLAISGESREMMT